MGVAFVAIGFADFGINSLTIRTLAQAGGRVTDFTTTLGAKVGVACVLGAGWCAGAGVLALRRHEMVALFAIGGYIAASVVTATLMVPLRVEERMTEVAIIGLAEKGVALAGTLLVFVQPHSGLWIPAVATAAGGLVATLLAIVIIDPAYRRVQRASVAQLVALWKDALSFGAVGAAACVARVDVVLVSLFAGGIAAGVYAAPARLTGFFGVIPVAFASALYPYVLAADDRSSAGRDVVRGVIGVIAVMLLPLGAVFALAPVIVPLVLGGAYAESAPVLRVALVTVVLGAVNQPLAMFLQAEGEEKFVALLVAATTIFGLGAIAIGAAVGGPLGAAAGVALFQAIALVGLAGRTTGVMGTPRHVLDAAGMSLTDKR
jgi:O-antigen/teichoic acid export membrane protein